MMQGRYVARLHQVMSDWLDETVKPKSTESGIHAAILPR
jgi:hypothetical protein